MNDLSTASTTTSIMLRAVAFNNDGVSMVERGAYNEATESFVNVLESLKPFIPRPGIASYLTHESVVSKTCGVNEGESSPVSSGSQDQLLEDSQQGPRSNSDKFQSNYPPPAPPSLSSERHFVFRDPIEIPVDVITKVTQPSTRLVIKFVVVAMYNLALASHLRALETNDASILRRAKKVYELAFQMHLEESCDVTLLYSLAVMNNLALIYHTMGDEERSKTYFKNMLATMMYLQESDEAKTIRQWEGLFSNVMDMMFKEQVVAASAA